MRQIVEPRISKVGNKFVALCKCGLENEYTTKQAALAMLDRGTCRSCRPDYRSAKPETPGVHRRDDGRWVSHCSGCGAEQAYTRKDHAKQSAISKWLCRKCAGEAKRFSENRPVGDKTRTFNRFRKSATDRGIPWELSEAEMFACFSGECAMTGWPISLAYGNQTASLDRVDSHKGYVVGNIQWVHSMVNMCKNKYPQDKFVEMCRAVARRCVE